jgi:hypothetical protein
VLSLLSIDHSLQNGGFLNFNCELKSTPNWPLMVLLPGKTPFPGYCCNACPQKMYFGSAISETVFVVARPVFVVARPVRM